MSGKNSVLKTFQIKFIMRPVWEIYKKRIEKKF